MERKTVVIFRGYLGTRLRERATPFTLITVFFIRAHYRTNIDTLEKPSMISPQIDHTRVGYPYRQQLRRGAPYLACALLSLFIFAWVTDLWKADFRVPFTYYGGGDLFWNAATTKGLMENGSYLANPNLGAPFGLQTYDFPWSESLHFLLLRVLSVFTGNYAATLNLFYVLSFPLTALSSLWVFRKFRISVIPAVICSLFYTFLYAHFGRGLQHFALACYFLVPLLFWVVLTIAIPDENQACGELRQTLKSKWFLGRLAVCVALASYGFYYSLFGMFFLAVGGLFAWTIYKFRTGFVTSLILVCCMLVTSLCNVLPNLIFWAKEGSNKAAVYRLPGAAESYGLKLTYLLLPNPGHRVAALAELRRFYIEQTGVNEASVLAGLGLIGSLGFILLLAYSVFGHQKTTRGPLFRLLGSLNLMGVLLATVGGFGAILSFLGFTQIRAYNRISVFIAFLALMAVALVWQNLEASLSAGKRLPFVAISVLVAIFGLWDEIPATVAPNYALAKAQWVQDDQYVNRLESSLPAGSMIFQLPYVPFPESPPVAQMTDYSHFRPYLHSRHLRWSYGATKGRQGAAWMEATSSLPLAQMVKAVATAGYAGIYIDRFGYSDRAAALESQLAGLLGTTPILSSDNRLCYFGLGALARKDAGQAPALSQFGSPVDAKWEGEFSILETHGQENWRWCGNSGVLRLINKSQDTAWVRLSSTVKTSWPENATVHVRSALFADELTTNLEGVGWEREIAVPPGEHLIIFSSEAKKNPASGTSDPRPLVFALYNFSLTRVQAPAGRIAPPVLIQRPVTVVWGAGTYAEEHGSIGTWHWCMAACEIDLANPSTTPAHIRISMGLSTGQDKPAKLVIKGPGISDTIPVVPSIRPSTYTLDLPPGKNIFRLSCDGLPATAPGDPRKMVVMVSNLAIAPISRDSN